MLHSRKLIAVAIVAILQLISVSNAQAQSNSGLLFTSDHDLSTTLINKIYVDTYGFVWIATEDGLNKFDGSKFTIYRSDPNDPNSLAGNYINTVLEDSKGRLFIGSHSGLQVYDYNTDTFSPVIKISGDDYYRGSISCVIERNNGEIWTFGQDICKVVVRDGNLELQPVQEASNINHIGKGIEDASGNIWFAKDRYGVYKITPDHKVKRYFGQSNDPQFSTFAVGADHKLYLGSFNNGLYRYDKDKDIIEVIPYRQEVGNRGLAIMDLFLDSNGVLHVATDGDGLKVLDYTKNCVDDSPINIWDDEQLKVHTVTEDAYGNLWIGMYQRGVLLHPKKENAFKAIVQRSLGRSLIGTSCVTSMLRDSDGCLWVGTDNNNMYVLSADLTSSQYLGPKVPDIIMSLYEDRKQRLWVGSYGEGTGTIDHATRQYHRIKLQDENNVDVPNVYDFTEDPDGNVWFATMGSGLFRYDEALGYGVPFKYNHLINPWMSSVIYSRGLKRLLVGTYDGLYIVDATTGEIRNIATSIIINAIKEDVRRNIWVASVIGLMKINKAGEIEHVYSVDDGLPSNTLFAIEEDDDGGLWISSNAGLCYFDPDTQQFVTYYVDDGLQSNEFYKKASFKDADGNLYFGGINGLTYFSPEEVTSSGRKLDLRLTDFYIHQTPVRPGMKSGSRTITDKPIFKSDAFYLCNNDNTFSVEFNTRQYPISSQVQFLYSLDGDKWELMPNVRTLSGNDSRILTFNEIKSGKHNLRIKAVDRGVESAILSITIDIAPAWYATWWAKILYVLLALSAILLLWWRYRVHERRKVSDVERAHIEDIKEAKLQFFTNISHEIRTPLTLVMSPLQKLLATESDPAKQKSYRTILRNCERILRLVNELMDLRKIDNNQMRLTFERVNLVGFISDVIETFSQTISVKHIDLTFNHQDYHDEPVWVDKSNFDKIIMNLLSNAVKYTPNDGSINIDLSTGHDESASTEALRHYVQIRITDTGIGIPEDARQHIFDRFYQVSGHAIGGTGIGLHLTHSLVVLHHGSIQVEDNPQGKGTVFIVRIPLGNDHLSPSELITPLSEIPAQKEPENIAQPTVQLGEESVPAADPGKGNKVVYIAEDDAEVRTYLVDNLKGMYQVVAFDNGVSAFEAICKKAPDLLITDVMMPQMDGLTLTRKIKQNVTINHVPVVLLTARNREEDTIEGLENGADAYITKPFNMDILAKRVQTLIESHQRLKNAFSGQQSQANKVEEIQVESSDDKLMERVMKVINRHISDSDITVEMIADEIGISRVHLHRKLKSLTNQSTRDFIRNIRLQEGARLLREKKLSVSEVSYLVGFKHPNNFSTVFKDMYGMTPSAYCEQYHDKP